MGRRDGSTLIESLLSVSIGFVIIYSMTNLFYGLEKSELKHNNDLSYCLYALTQEISKATKVYIEEDSLKLIYEQQEYIIHLHERRIVKEPGFNIYLHNIDNISFIHDNQYVYMKIERGGQVETFKIGVFYRPSYRVCESDCIDDITDNAEFDSGFAEVDSNLS